MAATGVVESWDDEFEGTFQSIALNSTSTAVTTVSSRMSAHSESIAGGDDDWNLVLQPDDEQSTHHALESAKAAGIPLPHNVPQSALLGGSIKRLGKQKNKQHVDDAWDDDIEMPDGGTLQLQAPRLLPLTAGEEQDDLDELEGSLGIRFAGTRREMRNRSSSASAMSPSLGSMTAESEEDELRGLELPEGPVDFDAMLKKRRAADAELSDLSQPSPVVEQPAIVNTHKKHKLLSDEGQDYLDDFDFGPAGVLDTKQRNLNRNVKIQNSRQTGSSQRTATTLNFHDKPTDKPVHTKSHIPRPVSGSKPATSRLEPVFETGASRIIRERRQPTTTSAQLLKSKRSMPVLRSHQTQQTHHAPTHKSSVPFLQSGTSNNQPQNANLHRPMPYHLRRDSDPHRGGAQSPPLRSHSRLSNAYAPDTPSRSSKQRPDVAPSALAREAAAKCTLTKPAKKRNYGDGNELDVFDDLPTSTSKESKYVKQPVTRGPSRHGLRQTQSRSDIRDVNRRPVPDRMMTPAPRTPASPSKGFYEAQTPSYLRDTAASRIARETRLGQHNPRPKSEGPLMPLSTNWKAHVAARSPHTSPSAQRQKTKRAQPNFIRAEPVHHSKTEKGMVYNPQALRWEGNENLLAEFDMAPPTPLETPTPTGHRSQNSYLDDHPHRHRNQPGQYPLPSSSPPRPALIAPMSQAAQQGIQVNGGMVFDPRQMKWLKLKKQQLSRDLSGPISPSATDGDDEEDAFAGIDDLKDDFPTSQQPTTSVGGAAAAAAAGISTTSMASPVSMSASAASAAGVGEVHEEFDLGPRFIELQQSEENMWFRRCAGWFPAAGYATGEDGSEARADDGKWRWAIRDIARDVPAPAAMF